MGVWHWERMKCEGFGGILWILIDIQEKVAVHMCDFGIQRGNCFRGEPIRTEVDLRVRKLKNGKLVGKAIGDQRKWR